MKQRTFLTTLVLFLLFFNLGIFIVSMAMFRDTVNRAEERSLDEHYFITSALIRDFASVESRGISLDTQINALLKPYGYLSGDNKAGLAFYQDDRLIYANKETTALGSTPPAAPENGNRLSALRKADGRTYVIVSGRLPSPYDAYTLIYFYDTTESISTWSDLRNLLFLAGFILSLLFALGLLLVLNRIFQPLRQISRTSGEIAAGAYYTRLPVSGHDELSDMARSFNHMADAIQTQMTELKNAAEQKQQFVDNFAHELRTPLTAIYGYAEYLEKAALSEDDRLSALHYIMTESRRLQTIAHQLLELANLENNQLTCAELNTAALFESVKQTIVGKLAEKAIVLDFNSELETLTGDEALLKSLLINLIDNGIKACAQGGRIAVRATEDKGPKIITIRDDGKGMTPEVLSQITEPFYREEKSRNRSDGGAGLGLALCKQIATGHNAELTFASSPGAGTTVKITFTTPS